MDLKKGDLVRTVAKVEKIQAVLGEVKSGMVGVVTTTEPKFNKIKVYGILIEGKEYFLFEDEIEKLEEKC